MTEAQKKIVKETADFYRNNPDIMKSDKPFSEIAETCPELAALKTRAQASGITRDEMLHGLITEIVGEIAWGRSA